MSYSSENAINALNNFAIRRDLRIARVRIGRIKQILDSDTTDTFRDYKDLLAEMWYLEDSVVEMECSIAQERR